MPSKSMKIKIEKRGPFLKFPQDFIYICRWGNAFVVMVWKWAIKIDFT